MELDELLKLNNALRKFLKDYSMIYQASLKESVANWFYLPLDTFYYFNYDKWSEIREKWFDTLEDIHAHFGEICEFHHCDDVMYEVMMHIPVKDMKDLYYIWAAETNHPVWRP